MENKEEIHSIFLDRLTEIARKRFQFPPDRLHGLRRRIAEATDIEEGTVRKWFAKGKKTIPDVEQFIKIYIGLGVSPNYLLGLDKKEKLRTERMPIPILELADLVEIKEFPLRPEEFVTVPLVSGTIAATIGDGIIVDEHIEDWAIIHKKVVGKKKNLISIRIDKKDGMSMYPILKPGDIVIIDREDIEIKFTGIYAVRIDDGCTVKKLQATDHQLLLIPENKDPIYKTKIIDLKVHQTPIIGRVIWCSKIL